MDTMMDVLGTFSWTAVLVATLAYYVLGALWFAPFTFGKFWDKAIDFERPKGWKFPPMFYVGPLIGCFVTTFVTAIFMSVTRMETYNEALMLGLVAGVGYAASVSFVNAITPKIPRPFLYGAITGGYHAAGIVLAALVMVAINQSGFAMKGKIHFSLTENRPGSYVEYAFDSGDDLDFGFTHRALEQLRKQKTLLDAGSKAVEEKRMKYEQLTSKNSRAGILERQKWQEDVYELWSDPKSTSVHELYRILKNGQPLFESTMNYGAEGPILDWRIVNDKPAFTFRGICSKGLDDKTTCSHDVWYDGEFISKKFDVKDPEYLFSYNDKIGFIASDDGVEKIFYDGKFISPGFDTIWFHNCCAMTEILPTVHENGTLLFYATRERKQYLAEVRLE